MKEVGILVVTYNRLQLLKEEIKSLRNQSYHNFQIIVVNNGSTDGTKGWLESQSDILTITQGNLGGAGGFFTGLKYIAEEGYKYCWLMDDDVECDEKALETLVKVAHDNPEIGFLCSRVFGTDHSLMNVPIIDDRKREGNYPNWLEKIDNNLIKVKSATFVSVLIPIKNVIEVGLPIKEFFIWGDDSEYTMRLSSKFDCYLVYKSIVIHKRTLQQTLNFMTETDSKRLKNYYYSLRNQFYNRKKYGKSKDIFITLCYQASLMLRSIIRLDFKRITILLKVYYSYFCFLPKIQYVESVCSDKLQKI